MSLQYWTRLTDSPPTVGQLVEESRRALRELIRGADVRLVAWDDTAAFIAASRAGTMPFAAGEGLLERVCSGVLPSFVITIGGDLLSAVFVRFQRVDEPADDPEAGDWMTVEASRTDQGYVLAIAVAVAAARLGSTSIVDEADTLIGPRLVEPDAVVRAIAIDANGASVAAAAPRLLAKTGLRRS